MTSSALSLFGGPRVSAWRATVSGFSAALVGIGLARFAYAPLLPAIIGAQWFTPAQGAYLGAANLAGYLAGAVLARPMTARLPVVPALNTMMLLATAAFVACAFPLSLAWFFVWRFASGLAGGALTVLGPSTVLPHVPAARRGLAAGVIFMGVGAGIALSGTLVPLLLRHGVATTWLGLGALALVLTAIAWGGWPRAAAPVPAPAGLAPPTLHAGPALRGLFLEYGLNAVGLVPHMIFLVDFVARGLGQGVPAGTAYWVLFGVGAMAGPILAGHLADRIGFGRALRVAFVVEAVAVALPLLGLETVGLGTVGLVLTSVVVGAFVPGIVTLVLGRVHELVPHDPAAQQRGWGRATISFAVLQTVGAYAMSFLFASGADYRVLFGLGSAALVVALLVDLVATRVSRRRAGGV